MLSSTATTQNGLVVNHTAQKNFAVWQLALVLLLPLLIIGSFYLYGVTAGRVLIGLVTIIYSSIVILKLFLSLYSFSFEETEEAERLEIANWPKVTILGPMYREAEVAARWVRNMSRLDYPVDRLEVLLLIRREDRETLEALRQTYLPENFRIVPIEPAHYGTKPAALNVGLSQAQGEFFVIYDAENGPEPSQVNEMVSAMLTAPPNVAAVQAVPVVSNWRTKRWWEKIPAKFQAAEYASHYTMIQPASLALGILAPLPGNSVLFRTDAVRAVGNYDRYNLTEDADIAVRLVRAGYRVTSILSETTEESPAGIHAWIKQRARWNHGFMQTYLVHSRNPVKLLRNLGPVNFAVFQLIVGGTPFVQLINPLMWGVTLVYWTTGSDTIQALYPWPTLYSAIVTTIIGTFGLMFYSLVVGMMRRQMYQNCLLMFAAPVYSVFMVIAAYRALWDISRKGGWHHTRHTDEEEESYEFREIISAAEALLADSKEGMRSE